LSRRILFWSALVAGAWADPGAWTVNGLKLGDSVDKKPVHAIRLTVNDPSNLQVDPNVLAVEAKQGVITEISGSELELDGKPILRFDMKETDVVKALAARGDLYLMQDTFCFMIQGQNFLITPFKNKLLRVIWVPPMGVKPQETDWQRVTVVKGQILYQPAKK
jgi:hypothetical protein